MDDVQSRWSNMVWKRFQTYFSVRAIHLNSMFSNFCHVLKLIILIIIGSLLILNHFCSYSRRIGNTRFYLIETMIDSKEGKPLAGLYYKPTATSGYIGENTPGFPKTILWNDHYIISKNFDGNNPVVIEYVIINIDSIKSDFGEICRVIM